MANVVSFTGEITSGPGSVSDACDAFPGSDTIIPLSLQQCPKAAPVSTGAMRMTLASPSAFVTLAGIGAGGPVTQATFFYFKCQVPLLLRLTFQNPSGPDTVSVLPVSGLSGPTEWDPSQYLKLVEVQGAGQIEWFASGNV